MVLVVKDWAELRVLNVRQEGGFAFASGEGS